VFAGWLGAGYAVAQFVCAPIIGNLSDRFGRRPVLLASVLAMALDYTLLAFAPALWWLVIGRIVAGMTGASWSAAYAYIADVTPPEKRAANFGLMGMAFGLGFILGPAIGGVLGGIDHRLPFLSAAGLAMANFLFGLMVLKESLPREQRRPFQWARANAFAALRALKGQSPRILWFVAALGVWQLAHTVYPVIWSYFTIAAFGFSEGQIGASLAVVGIVSALVQGIGVRFAAPLLGPGRSVALGVGGFVVAAVIYLYAGSTAVIYAAIVIGGLQGLIGPSIQALNSAAIDGSSQGELQGATQSISSIAQIIGPPLYTGIFAKFSGPAAIAQIPAMPLLVAAGIALVALALFWRGLVLARSA
jgi:DHA1 family tetracycline resistance protein-like MFS transporter